MENLRKMMLMLMCITFMGAISSCLNDDNNSDESNVLTPSQKSAQIFEMAGTYNGYVYFNNDTTLKLDSLACTWRLTAPDSTIIIPNFPVALLANGITDKNVKKCLNEGGTVPFKAVLHPYYNNNHTKGLYTFWMLVDNDKMEFTIKNEETTHNVKVNFSYEMKVNYSWANFATYYSIGEFSKGVIRINIPVKDIVFDDKTYSTTWPSFIYGKK